MSLSDVGRPTEAEFDRLEELVDEYFVGDSWAIECRCWDDGDVHLTAYSTIGTNCTDGYPIEVAWHRQYLHYQREEESCKYSNKLSLMGPPDRTLKTFEVEW